MFDDDEREHMPLEAREIHQQLLDDSSQWARTLPSDARVAEFARTLPRRMPSPSASPTRNVLAHRRPSSTLPDMMSVKGHTSMLKLQGARRTFAASIAAVAVVALIAGVLSSINNSHAGSGTGPGTGRPTPAPTLRSTYATPTPGPYGDYGATPGPLANYVSKLYTTGVPPSDGTPINVQTSFVVGDWVYVSAVVHGLPKGTHVVSIKWYLNGIPLEIGPSAQTSKTVDGDTRVVYGLQFPTSGVGMARIFIDRPASDTSESASDPYLAGTVIFAVEMPQPTVAPGNSMPTPTPGPTLTPVVPTPTPHP